MEQHDAGFGDEIQRLVDFHQAGDGAEDEADQEIGDQTGEAQAAGHQREEGGTDHHPTQVFDEGLASHDPPHPDGRGLESEARTNAVSAPAP